MLNAFMVPAVHSQPGDFVVRSADTLTLNGRPFFFLGTNAYYLLEQSARGDTASIRSFFQTASSLNMSVVRTWGFYDSSDSLHPAVIQYRPGVFNEHALRALDYVIYQAKLHRLRLLIPFVNSWDDYGGMNQYVLWRSHSTSSAGKPAHLRFSHHDLLRTVDGGNGRSYRYALTAQFGHDDFYSDPIIEAWFKNYVSMLLNRINVYTNIRYKDEPAIFGWELANEPRSLDFSTSVIRNWAWKIAAFVKMNDPNHLRGTGEEGFDATSSGYSLHSYNEQHWLFDGSAGVAFTQNSVIPAIDFCSCHLYPESWNISNGAGNAWIRDHVRIARSLGKPLLVGEFGVREQRTATYTSWMNTALLDGACGAMVWQILVGPRTNDGFGIRCDDEVEVCARLREAGNRFIVKSVYGSLPKPQSVSLQQNFPNPFNGVTTISYSLPFDANVNLSVFNSLGQHVGTIVEGVQSAGERRELLDGGRLASGPYFYRLSAAWETQTPGGFFSETKRLLFLK